MRSSATATKSLQDAKKRLTKFLKTLDTLPTTELARSADRIYADAVAQTPYKTGKLENAVYVRVSKNKSKPGIVAGASAKSHGYDYAGIQHENTDFKHLIKGKAHYISDPFNQEIERLQRRIRRKFRDL